MAELLPTVGLVSYNGVEFGAKTNSSVRAVPHYDQAERTVSYVIYTITAETIISSEANLNSDTDGDLAELRLRLLTPGGELHYEDKGFGGLTINVDEDSKDVVWGPKPRLLEWKPLGSNQACKVTWQVEVAIPECDDASFEFALMESNWRIQYALDQSGYTRITYSGYIRIPQTRFFVTSRQMRDNADRYREKIIPPLPAGYRREAQDFVIDESKCRMDYYIVDQQMPPNVPPPGVVLVNASHEVQSPGPEGARYPGYSWSGRLSADYELQRDVPRITAYSHFLQLMKERLFETNRAAAAGKGALILRSFSMAEPEIYGRKSASFSTTYTYSTTAPRVLLQASGLWRPLSTSDWNKWAVSLGQGALHPRGLDKKFLPIFADSIVDLCLDEPPNVVQPTGQIITTRRASILDEIRNTKPPKETSWLWYKVWLWIEHIDNVVASPPLPPNPPDPKKVGAVKGAGGRGGYDTGQGIISIEGSSPSGNTGAGGVPRLPARQGPHAAAPGLHQHPRDHLAKAHYGGAQPAPDVRPPGRRGGAGRLRHPHPLPGVGGGHQGDPGQHLRLRLHAVRPRRVVWFARRGGRLALSLPDPRHPPGRPGHARQPPRVSKREPMSQINLEDDGFVKVSLAGSEVKTLDLYEVFSLLGAVWEDCAQRNLGNAEAGTAVVEFLQSRWGFPVVSQKLALDFWKAVCARVEEIKKKDGSSAAPAGSTAST
jgi:hypothetical protein